MNMSMGVFIVTHCQGEVGAGVAFTVNPSLTGDAIVGETLTVSLGTATGATALAGSLRHVSDDTEIDTFTADGTYLLDDADFGEQLYLHVTAEPGGVTAVSAATGAVGYTLEDYIGVLAPSLWFQADAGDIAALAHGATISTWDDQSANSLDVTVPSGVFPTYQKNALNTTLPIVRFSGVANVHFRRNDVAMAGLVGTNAGSLIAVMKQDSSAASTGLLAMFPTGTTNNLYKLIPTASNSIVYDHADGSPGSGRYSVAQPTGWDDTWHILEIVRTGGSVEVMVDGVAVGTGSLSASMNTAQNIDLYLGWANFQFKGDVYALYQFPDTLTTDERNYLRRLLHERTAIPANF